MILTSLSDKIKFIENVFGSGKLARNAKNFDVKCPICDPKDQTKKKLAIHVEDGKVHCWVCGYRAHTLIPLIKKFSSHDVLSEYVEKFMPDISAHERKRQLSSPEEQKVVELPKDFKLLVFASQFDPDVNAVRRYIYDRNISTRDLWYFKIGVSNESRWHRRVIVPSFDKDGQLNYFVARAIDKRNKPKYDNPDFDKLPIIFNEINIDWKQQVVICEGVFDAFKCGDNTVPLLGSDLNEQSLLFNMILAHNTPVALALDSDMWETKTLKIAKKLSEYNIHVNIVDTRKCADPGSATKEQVKELLRTAKEFSWISSFYTRLDRASRMTLST